MMTPQDYAQHHHWLGLALDLARAAGDRGEIPVGAILVDRQQHLIAEGSNRREADRDPTAHAEIIALRRGGERLGRWHLEDCTLYVTLEPCAMCAGAILQSRLGLLVYGADEPKTGAIHSQATFPTAGFAYHRLPVLSHIRATECRHLLQTWFQHRRQQGRSRGQD